MQLPLVLFPSPILKTAVPKFEKERTPEVLNMLAKLMLDMQQTMKILGGIGLAANQVNADVRVFVMHQDKYFINPVVESGTGEIEILEKCLSFPGSSVRVKRLAEIVLKHEDIEGNVLSWPLTGIEAIVAQHEIDHLNGITFFDYASNVKKNIIKRKSRKLMRQLKQRQKKISRK